MTIRATLFFQQVNAGWSESFYSDEELLPGQAALTQLAGYRQYVLATGANIVGQRVSKVDPPGLSLVKNLSLAGGSGLALTTPYQSLLVDIKTADQSRRKFLIRGIPDARVNLGVYSSTPQYNTILRNYLNWLTSRWRLRVIKKSNPLIPIVKVEQTGAMQLAVGATWVAGQKVKLYRTTDTTGENVSFTFVLGQPVNDTNHFLLGWPLGREVSKGFVRLLEYDYPVIDDWVNTGRIASRRVGRPFGLPVGRRLRRQTLPPPLAVE